uniref:Uncharacterized protein n=1 Tax=Oryza rufipogon TaxID=4529 RepID=A0A0E0RIE9_ORYRU
MAIIVAATAASELEEFRSCAHERWQRLHPKGKGEKNLSCSYDLAIGGWIHPKGGSGCSDPKAGPALAAEAENGSMMLWSCAPPKLVTIHARGEVNSCTTTDASITGPHGGWPNLATMNSGKSLIPQWSAREWRWRWQPTLRGKKMQPLVRG